MPTVDLKRIALALVLIASSSPLFAETVSYCDDQEARKNWEHKVKTYIHSDDWQRLHALCLGLCEKVKNDSISLDRAIDLFEEERTSTIRKMRREIERDPQIPINPFG